MNLFEFVEGLNAEAKRIKPPYGNPPTPHYRVIVEHASGDGAYFDVERDKTRVARVRVAVAANEILGDVVSVLMDGSAPVESLRLIQKVVPTAVTIQ